MAHAYIKHPDINSGNKVRLPTSSIVVSGSCNLDTDPSVNLEKTIEVHKGSFENPVYQVRNLKISDHQNSLSSDILNYRQVLQLYKSKFNGSNPIRLFIEIGPHNDYNLLPCLSEEDINEGIPVVIDTFSHDLDTERAKDAKITEMSLTLVETGTE